MTSFDKFGIVFAVAFTVAILTIGLGMSSMSEPPKFTQTVSDRLGVQQEGIIPKISEDLIKKDDFEKFSDKDTSKPYKVITKLLKEKEKLKLKISPEMSERVKAISGSWSGEVISKKPLFIPSLPTSLDCMSEPPPAPAREVNWEHCDISFMEFYSDNLTNANMRYATAQNAVFVDVDLTELNGYNADFRFAEFNDTLLDEINLVNAKIGGTIFENSELLNANLNHVKCNEHISGTVSSYYPCIFHQSKLHDINAENIVFENIHFINSELYNTHIYNSEITNAQIIDSTLQDVELGGNIDSIQITRSTFEDFVVQGDVNVLRISNAYVHDEVADITLDGINLNILQITDSRLNDFEGYGIIDSIQITRSTFEDFVSEDIQESDITNSTFEYLDLSVRDLSLRDSYVDNLVIRLLPDGQLEFIGIKTGIEATYYSGHVYGDILPPAPLTEVSRITINNSELHGMNFEYLNTEDARINIRNSSFNDVYFSIDLSNAQIIDSEFVDTQFSNIDMSHARINHSILINPIFENVDLSRANLSGTEIIGGTFTGVTTGDRPLGCTGHPICD
tara:strand:+ start:185 stop:1879 length:1695 start_codon:yes stop_codon:yes gene_type:complete